jgi:hypothetical protein
MEKTVLIITMCTLSLLVTACTKGGTDGAGGPKTEQKQAQPVNKADSDKVGIVAAIKGRKLTDFKTLTIGEAFDNYPYFDKRKWKESRTDNGKIYVDFWGWFKDSALDAASKKNGVVARGVEVKFVINPDGDFYLAMISRTETSADGTEHDYPIDDKQGILKAIYANKEITF